jgi:hypothetical protein
VQFIQLVSNQLKAVTHRKAAYTVLEIECAHCAGFMIGKYKKYRNLLQTPRKIGLEKMLESSVAKLLSDHQ